MNPIDATAGNLFAEVTKFPDFHFLVAASKIAPSLRGKNSYQAPTPDLSRSERTLKVSLVDINPRIGSAAIACNNSSVSMLSIRCLAVFLVS